MCFIAYDVVEDAPGRIAAAIANGTFVPPPNFTLYANAEGYRTKLRNRIRHRNYVFRHYSMYHKAGTELQAAMDMLWIDNPVSWIHVPGVCKIDYGAKWVYI